MAKESGKGANSYKLGDKVFTSSGWPKCTDFLFCNFKIVRFVQQFFHKFQKKILRHNEVSLTYFLHSK